MTTKSFINSAIAVGALAIAHVGAAQAAEPTVVTLTQTACQFVESENGVDHGFRTAKAEDCKTINGESGAERATKAKTLVLKPGEHVFRVTNRDVPYELGFWLRGDGLLGRATLPSVSGGGLTKGKTQDYKVDLVEGEYLYSCPLNPTLDYKIVVKS